MGTVHAKARTEGYGEVGTGLLGLDDPIELDDEPITKPSIKLNGVRARVDRVHVDGLSRTKDDVVRSTVDDLFHATDFEDVILRAHKVRSALDATGCFRDIGVFIDVSSGPGATPEGLESPTGAVPLHCQILHCRRAQRRVGQCCQSAQNIPLALNAALLRRAGVKMPNVAGRGERVQAEYSVGHRSSSNFSVTASKPFLRTPLTPTLSTSVYQQNHEYPWSGYRLLDRGVMLDLAFNTSPSTKHNLQWEGLVRETSVLNKTTSFKVRESSGPQMKSVLRHVVTVDHRDEAVFPTRGTWLQFSSALAGLGGGVAHVRTELQAQANGTVPGAPGVVFQATGAVGVLHDMFGTELADRFFLGGPATLRGFAQRGVGPRADGLSLGGTMYWATGLHIYAPLPFVAARGGLSELFRSHLFLNGGCLAHPEEGASVTTALSEVRVAGGCGVALRLGKVARVEFNYCFPLRASPKDLTASGLQLGVAAHFL